MQSEIGTLNPIMDSITNDETEKEKQMDNDASSVDLPAELPPPPDGGWGWVVVFASFISNLIVDGTSYSFGASLIVLANYFNESQGKVALINSLMCGVCLLVGPIVSALVNKFGCRQVFVFGTFVASSAFALTVVANSVYFLIIFQGVIAGCGLGMMYLPAIVCVGHYFEKKRSIATSIAVSGSGLGTILFPLLTEFLMGKYGWQVSNGCTAAMLLYLVFMGLLMRPLEVQKMTRKTLLQRLAEEKKLAMEIGSLYGSSYCFVTHSDGTVEWKMKPGCNVDPGVHSHLNLIGNTITPVPTALNLPTIVEDKQLTNEDVRADIVSRVNSIEDKVSMVSRTTSKRTNGSSRSLMGMRRLFRNTSQQSIDVESLSKMGSVLSIDKKLSKVDLVNMMKIVPGINEPKFTNMGSSSQVSTFAGSGIFNMIKSPSKDSISSIRLPPLGRQDIFYAGKIQNLHEFQEQGSMGSYRESTYSLQEYGSRIVMEALGPDDEEFYENEKCGYSISSLLDVTLLRNPVFLLIGFANLIGMLGFYVPFIYLPAAAIEKNVDQYYATALISVLGIASTVGRISSGFISTIENMSAMWVSNISLIISSLAVLLTPLATTLSHFMVIAAVFGFFSAAFISMTSIVLVDLLGLRNLTNSFGLLLLFRGIASMVGTPLAGIIYESSGSYDASFYCGGSLLLVCSAMCCCIPILMSCNSFQPKMVKYHSSEDYLKTIPEENLSGSDSEDEDGKSECAEEGIMFTIKSKVMPMLSLIKDTTDEASNKETNSEAVA